jgi:hypothetical protein
MITKELKEQPVIAVDELQEGGVYMTHTKDLVQVRTINRERNELHVYNITESCNVFLNLKKHHLIKKIR